MLGIGYYLKMEKNQFQARKPICPNRKNLFPQNTKKIASPLKKTPTKISCHTLFSI